MYSILYVFQDIKYAILNRLQLHNIFFLFFKPRFFSFLMLSIIELRNNHVNDTYTDFIRQVIFAEL